MRRLTLAANLLHCNSHHEKNLFFSFCICDCTADQRLCFHHIDRNFRHLSSLTVQPGLCQTWSEISKSSFLMARLILCCYISMGSLNYF